MLNFFKNRKKLVGMNSRNLRYIRPNNSKKAIRIADDKILSKKVLKKGGIPIPRLIAKISSHEDLDNFDWAKLPNSFALKPNRGFGGEGIIVVYGRKKGRPDAWVKADGSAVTIEDFKNHIQNILDGNFSLSSVPDTAFFEERLKLLKLFKPYTFKGIPDIRVIVYNKVPVMAMLRLPTKESGGKANLQQGAVGVGIDLATGVTTTAVQGKKSRIIEYVPNSRLGISGLAIPYWREILELAVKAQEISGLGFLGADVAIDKERGPVFLELNARPGLSIQVANLSGLKERLERVTGLKIKKLKRGVNVGMDLFGGEVEEEVEEISGRRVIGVVEKVKLTGRNAKEVEVEAKIDTGAEFTSIDIDLAKNLGFEKTIEAYESLDTDWDNLKNMTLKERESLFKEVPYLLDTAIIHSSHGTTYRPVVRISIVMDKKLITAKATIISRSHLKYPIIIGRKNLGRFLIDVNN
ncbi:MAG: sugar-transfer associated ATP-grasp domain-containing protein [Candidatus Moranbacteria bacterium]|jgi:alpha-L-glutamate ligase-like protein|nr:sugar-transfer associated ATP-grasp domain-containing protein [Candidatus Moranbacteria bacterium]MDD5652091.1 sugar-transfer associated ATP-grasp domain-containing protein [Candidatus Moranbacteria bacterium]MDX9855569.1 sugar-transfer associated ATP-grasp domain-containing protein [Candidatus Moranbacteria bacterium]